MSLLSDYLARTLLEQSSSGIVVLLPGGFKPPHAGHLDLVKRYLARPEVSQVRILVGPKERDGITRKQSLAIWAILLAGNSKVVVESVREDNPMLAAFKYIESAEPGTYALGSSDKGDDYTRVKAFIAKHAPRGPYARAGIRVVELAVSVKPLLYKNRKDSLSGKPISASVLRADIASKDTSNIASNYPGVPAESVKQITKILLNRLDEGGAAGHLAHPYEDMDLTFSDVENMITAALGGEVELAQEKLDGQNLMVSYRNGQIVAARNKGHVKDFGANALTLTELESLFAGRGAIQAAFTEAMRDLEQAIGKLTTSQRSKFFGNGRRFLNLEVLYPDTTNVIPYGATQLRLHNIRTYDQQGNVVSESQDEAKMLDGALRQVQADNQKTYQIKVTNPLTIKRSKDYENQKKQLLDQLEQLRSKYQLTATSTLGDYYTQWWSERIDQQAAQLGFKLPSKLKKALIARWGFDRKTVDINTLRKLAGSNGEFVQWINSIEQSVRDLRKQAARPLESVFLKLGVYTLQNAENLIALNPNQSLKAMKQQLKSTIQDIKRLASQSEDGSKQSLEFLKRELARLKDLGGFSAIVPSEGLVFKYNGKLYKLTGSFAPVNQILGYLRF